jgi:sugar phosphate permease
MVGNLASAAPLASALDAFGWSKAFALCAGAGVLVLIALVVVLKDKPGSRSTKVEHGKVGGQIKAAWAEPGTRLGLWAHFTCGCFPQVFLLLWGFPFLVEGEGLSEGTASSLLTVAIVANMASGPFIGAMVGRRPGARLPMVVGMPVLCGILWAVVLGLPGHAPLWLLVLLSAVIGVGGPLSLVGMDFARQGNPEHRLGTVSGIVNVGGFAAAAVTLFGIGVILDALSPGDGDRSLDAFRVALSVQALPLILGLAQILRYARKVAPVKAPALVTV